MRYHAGLPYCHVVRSCQVDITNRHSLSHDTAHAANAQDRVRDCVVRLPQVYSVREEADGRKKERTPELVYAALKAGFRGIDTACQPKVSYHSLS